MAGMSSRIGSGLVSGPGVTGTTQMAPSLNSTNHVVPNLQSMRRSSPNSSSQYSQWRLQKDLGGRCSWKFVAIFFVLLSVILVSALIYTTGKSIFINIFFFVQKRKLGYINHGPLDMNEPVCQSICSVAN